MGSSNRVYARAFLRDYANFLGLDSVERDGATIVLKFRPDARIDPAMLFKLIKSRRDLTLLPPAVLKLALEAKRAPQASVFERLGALLDQLSHSLVAG